MFKRERDGADHWAMPPLRRRRSARLVALSLAALTCGLTGGLVTASPASAEPSTPTTTDDAVVKACDIDHCSSPEPEDIVVAPSAVLAGSTVSVSFACDYAVTGASAVMTGPADEGPVVLSMGLDGYDAAGSGTVPADWSGGVATLDLACVYGIVDSPEATTFTVLALPPPPTTVPSTTTTTPPTTLPASPPASMGALDVSVTSLLPEGSTELVATGYQPGSEVRFAIYSEPVLLGTAVAGTDGVARLLATLPPGMALGAHTVVSFGVSPEGTERVLSRSVTVAEPAPATAAPATLARTGRASGPLTAVGTLLVAAGALVLGARRRTLAAR